LKERTDSSQRNWQNERNAERDQLEAELQAAQSRIAELERMMNGEKS